MHRCVFNQKSLYLLALEHARRELIPRAQYSEPVADRFDAEVQQILSCEQAERAAVNVILSKGGKIRLKVGIARSEPFAHLILAPAVEGTLGRFGSVRRGGSRWKGRNRRGGGGGHNSGAAHPQP